MDHRMRTMEASNFGQYPAPMSRKTRATSSRTPDPPLAPEPGTAAAAYTRAGEIMGQALRLLRRRYARTQEVFCERTGEGQSSLSEAENGRVGWDTVNRWSAAVGRAGADPLDLIRVAAALAEPDPELRELATLWAGTPEHTRRAVLILLRGEAASRSGAR